MDCFTADFLRIFNEKRQNLAIGWAAVYSPSNSSISGIFLKFPNFVRQVVRQLVHSLCGDNLVPFHMWWRQIVLKSEKVCKYFVQVVGYVKSICSMLVSSNNWIFCFIIIIFIGKFVNRYISCIVVDFYWLFIS